MERDHLMTSDGLVKLQEELDQLEGEGRREIAERIKIAREWGDLKENAEYHDAKNSQAHLETRIARLREKIHNAVIVDQTNTDGKVGFGSTVTLTDTTGKEQTWTIVASDEAAPAQGKISVDSPIAQALLHHRAGETVQVRLPKGEKAFVIVRVA